MFWQHGRLLKDIDQVNDLNLNFHYQLKISKMVLSEFAIEVQLSCVLYVVHCLSIGIILFYILQYIFIRFIHLKTITNRMNTE